MPSFERGISVVICTYNGKSRLAATLQSIFSLQDPMGWPWELIVIDNASTDGTGDYCREQIMKAGFQDKARVMQEPNQGCNHARLKGLHSCTYQWMLFCDDDNHLSPDYLVKGAALLEQHQDVGVLGGYAQPLFESQAPQWFEQYKASFAVGPQFSKEGLIPKKSGAKLYSAGSFFNREALLKYYSLGFQTIMVGPNGNDLTRGEDTEWCMMIQLAGYDLYYSSELTFMHYMPDARMNWDYYLRLKKGIASGIARLAAYMPFYKKENPQLSDFLIAYFKEWLRYKLLQFKSRLNKDMTTEAELGKIIITAKARAFALDFKMAKAHFLQLQKTIKRLKDN